MARPSKTMVQGNAIEKLTPERYKGPDPMLPPEAAVALHTASGVPS
jgi:hypothetical protein